MRTIIYYIADNLITNKRIFQIINDNNINTNEEIRFKIYLILIKLNYIIMIKQPLRFRLHKIIII